LQGYRKKYFVATTLEAGCHRHIANNGLLTFWVGDLPKEGVPRQYEHKGWLPDEPL